MSTIREGDQVRIRRTADTAVGRTLGGAVCRVLAVHDDGTRLQLMHQGLTWPVEALVGDVEMAVSLRGGSSLVVDTQPQSGEPTPPVEGGP